MYPNSLRLAGAIAALSLLPAFTAQAETLTVKRVDNAIVMGLSADASAAVGQLPGTWETFRWTVDKGVMPLGRATMPVLGVRAGIPRISADGKVVAATVLNDDSTLSTAGRWTASTGWQVLSALGPVPDGMAPIDNSDSSVFGMSSNGKVIAGLYWMGESWRAHAMRWTSANGMKDSGSSGRNSRINAVNADGSVMVGWDEHPDYGNWRAAVWVKGKRSLLEDSDWFTEATAVNSDGTIIVGQTPDPANGNQNTATMWKWNGTSWDKTFLGVMPKKPGVAASSMPMGVSDDGSVVVGQNNPDASKPTAVGFIWTPSTGMLDASAWLASNGVAVNKLWPIIAVGAVTPDGTTIAVNQQQKISPWGSRSLIVRREP